jgi:hypothetical protein
MALRKILVTNNIEKTILHLKPSAFIRHVNYQLHLFSLFIKKINTFWPDAKREILLIQ